MAARVLHEETSAWIAVMAVLAGTLVWREGLGRDVFALSYDDFLRVAHATDAGMDRLFPSDLWPPLPFWLTSAALAAVPDTRVVPGAVNLAASALGLVSAVFLGRAVGLGPRVNAGVVIALGLLPWWRWLSMSALAEPLTFAPMALAATGLAWSASAADAVGRDRRSSGLWLASAALTVGGMVRYEVWGAAAVFAALLLPRVRARLGFAPLPRPVAWVAGALPFVFPAAWMSLEFGWTRDPVYFATIARDNAQLEPGAVAGPLALVRDVVVSVGPLVAAAGWAAMPVLRRRVGAAEEAPCTRQQRADRDAAPPLRALVVFTAALLALHALAQLVALTGAHNTPRHYVALAPLLAVLGAVALARLPVRRAVVIGAAIGLVPLALAGAPPDAITPEVGAAAEQVRAMRASGVLAPHDRVLVEATPWDCFALAHVIGTPGVVEWDRNPFAVEVGAPERTVDRLANPSLLAQPVAAVQNDLNLRRVGIVVTMTPRGASWTQHVATAVGGRGNVRVWRVRR